MTHITSSPSPLRKTNLTAPPNTREMGNMVIQKPRKERRMSYQAALIKSIKVIMIGYGEVRI